MNEYVGCRENTNPIKLRADWRRPSIHAVPSLQPVVLEKLVKTNSASILGDVASRTMLMTTTLIKDQYTGDGLLVCALGYRNLPLLA